MHPSEQNDLHQFYLMCADIEDFAAQMRSRDVLCSEIQDQGWGRLAEVTLPGGGQLGVYEPRHERPDPMPGS